MKSILAVAVALSIALTGSVASSFDECTSAVPLSVDFSGGPIPLTGFATDGVGDPIRSCTSEPGHSNIWGTVTPTTDGILYVSGDANITIYAGTCGALTELACSTPGGSDGALLAAGVTYYLELSAPPDVAFYTTALCGDGNVLNQQCDDGNLVDTDGCTSECLLNVCGDGTLYIGVEECDDGNLVDTDACTDACTAAECGDGSLYVGVEECDDGNLTNGDGCESDCTIGAVCGNGVPEGGEECDDGNGVNGDPCTNACLLNVCGDGFVNAGVEQCDDGNVLGGDGCEANCWLPSNDTCALATPVPVFPMLGFFNLTGATIEPSDPVRSCTGEQGPHNRWFTYTVPADVTGRLLVRTGKLTSVYTGTCGAFAEASCQAVPSAPFAPFVTDIASGPGGQTYYIEVAGTESGSGLFVSVCGDGIADPPFEHCDDANADDLDACSNLCQPPACGDGAVQSGEQCDDGNLDDGDGCEHDCYVTSVCGDNTTEGHETCDDGNLVDDDGCDADCRLPCPDNLCKCLGAANQFTVVGGKLGVKNGKYVDAGVSVPFPTEIEGNVCGLSGTFGAKLGGETELEGDLVLRRASGYAGVFKTYKDAGVTLPGTYLLGDLATGGGLVKSAGVDVGGVIDTGGIHPLVAQCTQASLDVTAAATTLAAVPPTQTLSEIVLAAGEDQTIAVGPGRQVLSIPAITLKGYTSLLDGAALVFALDPATEVLIVNVPKVALGPGAEILLDDQGGSGAYGIINLGPDGKATIKKDAALELPLLAGDAAVSVPDGAFTGAVFTTGGVKLQGGVVTSSFECEE